MEFKPHLLGGLLSHSGRYDTEIRKMILLLSNHQEPIGHMLDSGVLRTMNLCPGPESLEPGNGKGRFEHPSWQTFLRKDHVQSSSVLKNLHLSDEDIGYGHSDADEA